MNQYEEFLEKIKEYFAYDEVVSDGVIISAYDLINILREKMKELHSIIYDDKNYFVDLIEKFYTRQETYGVFFKKKRNVSLAKVDFISQTFQQGHSEFYVSLKDINYEKIDYDSLSICKDNGTEELYFRENYGVDKAFVEQFQDLILSDFEKLEEFYSLFQLTNPGINKIPSDSCIKEEISDGFLKIVISYDVYGIFIRNIAIEKQVDFDNIYAREWVNYESLKDYVNSHSEELLKRIPINILNLKSTTQKIITDYYSKNNKEEQQLKLK